MGHIKDLLVTIYGGGEEAVDAAVKLADIEKQKRAYDEVARTDNAEAGIDIVTFLRGLSFATNSPSADDSATLLHYAVNETADLIESMREERRWIPVSERLPESGESVLIFFRPVDEDGTPSCIGCDGNGGLITVAAMDRIDGQQLWSSEYGDETPTHWMPFPEPPEVK